MSADNTASTQVSTTTVLLILATIFVLLRFWARHHVAARYGTDDYLIVAGLFAVYIIGGLNYGMVSYGMGQHASVLEMTALVNVFKQLLGFECMYVTAVALIKLSILAMYLRIFPSREFKIASYTIGGIIIAWMIAIILVCIFQCAPIYKAWVPWADGTCINLRGSFIGNAVPNLLTDVAILIMPMKQVWHLHATMAQKISLLCTFSLGSFVLIASIYRFTTIMAFDQNDTTWTLATPCTWCVVECACGVICACLPTLRPLAKRVSSKFGSSEKSKNKSQGHRTTELVTIGGGGSHMHSRAMTKSPFERLDDDSTGGKYGNHHHHDGEEQLRSAPRSKFNHSTVTETSAGYASSGESIDVQGVHVRTEWVVTETHVQQGKGFV